MTDKRTLPHNLREPNRSCNRCNKPFYSAQATMCPPCRKAARRRKPMNRPGFARGWGSGHLAPLGDGVSIHDFPLNWRHVVD